MFRLFVLDFGFGTDTAEVLSCETNSAIVICCHNSLMLIPGLAFMGEMNDRSIIRWLNRDADPSRSATGRLTGCFTTRLPFTLGHRYLFNDIFFRVAFDFSVRLPPVDDAVLRLL